NMVHSLEVVANSAVESLEVITAEMAAIRTVATQNHLALDYLLSAQGGTCAVIGAECCTYFPDNSEEITDLIQKIRTGGEPSFDNKTSWKYA
uniref:ERVV2 protein n=1 Tax=Salmo trutta TaxID=8032 RepID=A0A673W064_SALTR